MACCMYKCDGKQWLWSNDVLPPRALHPQTWMVSGGIEPALHITWAATAANEDPCLAYSGAGIMGLSCALCARPAKKTRAGVMRAASFWHREHRCSVRSVDRHTHTMDDLKQAFGDDWAAFVTSLAENDVDLEEIREYSKEDLAETVVAAIPKCNVHRKNKLVKALVAYFASTAPQEESVPPVPPSPSGGAAGVSAEDAARLKELMAQYNAQMAKLTSQIQVPWG